VKDLQAEHESVDDVPSSVAAAADRSDTLGISTSSINVLAAAAAAAAAMLIPITTK